MTETVPHSRLLHAVAAEARRAGGVRLVPDSGIDNMSVHRIYYRQGLLGHGLDFSRAAAA